MKLYIGITKDNELYYIEWDKVENEQKKTFSLCGGCYDSPKTETQGEEEAREVLSDESYYKDLGYFNGYFPDFLKKYIDFKEVAEEIINTDGWENTNGEYSHFGEYENKEIYLNSSSGGQHQLKRNDFIKLWIGENDFKTIMDLWTKEHLTPLKEKTLKKMEEIFNFNSYQDLFNEQEVLIKYLKGIKWEQ